MPLALAGWFRELAVVHERQRREVPDVSNPQQPEQRRSQKGGATPQSIAELKARQTQEKGGGHAHGTDKGNKGGGKGGGVPPDEQSEHP
jgi:hypothetical protein